MSLLVLWSVDQFSRTRTSANLTLSCFYLFPGDTENVEVSRRFCAECVQCRTIWSEIPESDYDSEQWSHPLALSRSMLLRMLLIRRQKPFSTDNAKVLLDNCKKITSVVIMQIFQRMHLLIQAIRKSLNSWLQHEVRDWPDMRRVSVS